MTFRRGVRLAVDWGDARIGVAACDPDGVLAFPVAKVAAGPAEAAELTALLGPAAYAELARLCALRRSGVGAPHPASGQTSSL